MCVGMPTIEFTLNNWQLPEGLREQFVAYILSEDQGYQLEAEIDESFTFSDDELKTAGIAKGKDRKLLLAKLESGNLLIPKYIYLKLVLSC